MMDLSDGIAADAPRLARASGCGLALDPAKLPRNRGCTIEQASSDGEDFELLFAISPSSVPALLAGWKTAFPRVPLSAVGNLSEERAGLQPDWVFQKGGYDHFQ